MGIPVLILGESGSGKSTSLRNFKEGEICIFNVANKPLPFRNKLTVIPKAGYAAIFSEWSSPKYKRYVIDDSQYLLVFEMFQKAKTTGYEKFTDMALHFYGLIKRVIEILPDDVTVYFLHHTQKTEQGVKAKTIGKVLDEKLTLEGLFSVVLMAEYVNDKYIFRTQTNGMDTIKSPMAMFPLEIDNDLKYVDQCIREYWGLLEEGKGTEE